jgi:effector-binding domain-containing protein
MRSVRWTLFITLGLFLGCGQSGSDKEEVITTQETGGEERMETLALNYEELDLPERHYLVFLQELSLLDMEGFLEVESKALVEAANEAGITPLGPPTSLFYQWDTEAGRGEAAVALPVAAEAQLPPYVNIALPASRALSLEFEGSYDRLSAMHYALDAEMQRRGHRPRKPSIEEYSVGPLDSVEVAAFRTRIIYPIEASPE